MVANARAHGKLFVPCVAPGYDDSRVRPWNGANSRAREDGAYYDRMWSAALEAKAEIVAVTSFNEWHEGTQIEEAAPFASTRPGVAPYLDYGQTPARYLESTSRWVEKLDARLLERTPLRRR